MQRIISFLERLEERNISFSLSKIRDSILVTVAVPGERWEIEFMEDDSIQIEKFITTAHIYDESEIDHLFSTFSD